MATIKALFTMAQVGRVLDSTQDGYRQKKIDALLYLGNEFVAKARTVDTYKDRTGNLRSSIGFLIVEDGKILHSDFLLAESGSDRQTGKAEGLAFAKENIKDGELALIGVAGMEYAFFVEKNGFDVISGSAPRSNDLLQLLG